MAQYQPKSFLRVEGPCSNRGKFPLDQWIASSDFGIGPVGSITELAQQCSDFFPDAIPIFSSCMLCYKSHGQENNNLPNIAHSLTSVTPFGPRE